MKIKAVRHPNGTLHRIVEGDVIDAFEVRGRIFASAEEAERIIGQEDVRKGLKTALAEMLSEARERVFDIKDIDDLADEMTYALMEPDSERGKTVRELLQRLESLPK